MLHSLPLFHRIAGQPVIVAGEGEAVEAKRRLVERAGGVVMDEAGEGARLAFVAMPDPDATATRLKARGLLVNVADRPDLCDFTLPSLLDRDPVLIAIGTGGASAGLAKALRLRLEAILPQSLGALAKALDAARDSLRARFPDAADRRRALDEALAEHGPLDPLRYDGKADVPASLAATAPEQTAPFEFTLTSGDPDDLTLAQARALGSADLIVHEPGVPPAVLHRARADAARRAIARGEGVTGHSGRVVVIRQV